MNHLFILAGAALMAFGITHKFESKPDKKELTPKPNLDNVQIPDANNVPKPDETENKTDITDNSGLDDSGKSI